MASKEFFIPSIAIEPDEIRLPDDSAFAEICTSKAQELVAHVGAELRESVLTFSKSTGLIWRSDFTTKDPTAAAVNRVVCWQRPTDRCIQIAVASAHSTPALSDYLRSAVERPKTSKR